MALPDSYIKLANVITVALQRQSKINAEYGVYDPITLTLRGQDLARAANVETTTVGDTREFAKTLSTGNIKATYSDLNGELVITYTDPTVKTQFTSVGDLLRSARG